MNDKRTPNRIFILCLLTSVLLFTYSIAEEATEESSTPESQEPQSSSGAVNTNRAPNTTFIPSEEISEDLPVSFPADI